MDRATFIIRPRADGRGYTLTGPTLPWPMWYKDECHAASYAHHRGQFSGGRIIFLDSRGHCIITERIESAEDLSRPAGLGRAQ